MKTRLVLFNCFNLLEAVLTLLVINMGFAYELNPFMNSLIGSPFVFLLVKVLLYVALTLWIAKKNDKYSNIASWVVVIFSGLIFAWNLVIYIVSLFAILFI